MPDDWADWNPIDMDPFPHPTEYYQEES